MAERKKQILKEINVENNLATKAFLDNEYDEMHKHLEKVEELKKEFNEVEDDKETDR